MHYGKKIRGKIKINNFKELKKTSSFFICKNKLYRYNYTYIIPILYLCLKNIKYHNRI
nr:MAG TPA: hypothetical protein [Caudoviricetes sp.]